MRFLRTLVICLAATLPLPAAMAQAIDYKRLDARISRLASNDEEIVGLAVAVIDQGEISFAKGYGVTERGGAPVTDHTVFRWASVSKGVAASEVAILADQHKLNLTDTVSAFKTSLRLPGGAEQRATLEDILSHRLGLVPNAYDTRLEDGWDPARIRRSCPASSHSALSAIATPTRMSPMTRSPRSSRMSRTAHMPMPYAIRSSSRSAW